MSVSIEELLNGDEVQCWMKLGLALRPVRSAKGQAYYKVPSKTERARAGDLTRFIGWVVRNDPNSAVLTVQVSPFNSWRQPIRQSIPRSADISYTAFQRVRKFSTISVEPRQQILGHRGSKDIRRPGSVAAFGGTDLRPYRTVEEVLLP